MPETLADTTFPTGIGKDLATATAMLQEVWRRYYPQVGYCAVRRPAVDSTYTDPTPSLTRVTGQSPDTVIDDLWNEAIPGNTIQLDSETGLETYTQPHTSFSVDATDKSQRRDPVLLHARINPEPEERALSRYGTELQRPLIATFVVADLTVVGITVTNGDRFHWKDVVYEVYEWRKVGYWKNTSLHLYVETLCGPARYGS